MHCSRSRELISGLCRSCNPRLQAGIAAVGLAGYVSLLTCVPAPGICAAYDLSHDLVTAVDLHFRCPHRERWPHALEGWDTTLSPAPTVVTTLIALLIRELLVSPP